MPSEDLRDELDAIDAIYPESMVVLNGSLIDLTIPGNPDIKVRISFPETYPEIEGPHILQVRSPGSDEQYLKGVFESLMKSVFSEGAVCIFDFLTQLEDTLQSEIETADTGNGGQASTTPEPIVDNVNALDGWISSEPVTDRGSTFIAYAREVHSEDEAYKKLSQLKTDKRIGKASHNMVAFRIQNDNGTRVSDCDDDGETAAGGRMLHLLTVMDVWNIIVVVSRWFGGTHIGPDRFRHINSTTRDAVIRAGFLEDNNSKVTKKSKKK